MAEITASTTYLDGVPLDITNHNDNVHSATESKGIMSEANGLLTTANLRSPFEVKAKHVMMEQAALARIESMRRTCTIYGDAVPTPSNEAFDSSDPDKWFTLPGCSLRWYQPFEATAAVMHWSVFIAHNTWSGWVTDSTDELWRLSPETAIIAAIDGDLKSETRRYLPPSHFAPVSPGARKTPGLNLNAGLGGKGGNPKFVDSSTHTAMHWDLSTVVYQLSKGYHEISLRCRIESVRCERVYLQLEGVQTNSFTCYGWWYPTNLISLGIRNARVLTLL